MAVTIDGSQGLDTDNTELTLELGGSEKARIDSSGNLLVGKTSSSSSTTGFEARPAGLGVFTRDGNRPLVVNRLNSDGELILFNKDTTTVGRIGTASNDLYIGDDSVNLRFRGGSNNIIPATSDGGIRNNAIDLGQSTSRFKNLYLGGGVYLGGTGTANYLDDYEEGTWTPTVISSSGSPTYVLGTNYYFKSSADGSNSSNILPYTKVGNTVHIRGSIVLKSSFTDRISISLPFAIKNNNYGCSGACGYFGTSVNTVGFLGRAQSYFDIFECTTSGGHTNISYTNGDEIYFNFSYITP